MFLNISSYILFCAAFWENLSAISSSFCYFPFFWIFLFSKSSTCFFFITSFLSCGFNYLYYLGEDFNYIFLKITFCEFWWLFLRYVSCVALYASLLWSTSNSWLCTHLFLWESLLFWLWEELLTETCFQPLMGREMRMGPLSGLLGMGSLPGCWLASWAQGSPFTD